MKPAVTDDGSDIGLLFAQRPERRHLPFKLMIFIVETLEEKSSHIMYTCILRDYSHTPIT